MTPRSGPGPETGAPKIATLPAFASMKPPTMFNNVVLPQPLGPSTVKNSPVLICISTSANACVRPDGPANQWLTLFKLTAISSGTGTAILSAALVWDKGRTLSISVKRLVLRGSKPHAAEIDDSISDRQHHA